MKSSSLRKLKCDRETLPEPSDKDNFSCSENTRTRARIHSFETKAHHMSRWRQECRGTAHIEQQHIGVACPHPSGGFGVTFLFICGSYFEASSKRAHSAMYTRYEYIHVISVKIPYPKGGPVTGSLLQLQLSFADILFQQQQGDFYAKTFSKSSGKVRAQISFLRHFFD